MPKVKISEYSATANSNTDVASINIDEGCAPSGINNAIRAVMGHLKDFQQGTNGDPFNGPVNGTLGATTASTANVTTLTTSSTVTHNGGTANGVAYLNGSKVLTTGSALVFDGTNLGVGVTPSAWDANGKAIENPGGALYNYTTDQQLLIQNAFFDGAWKYKTTAQASYYQQAAGKHAWFNAASGTAGNAITFTQAMTLDASGNLGVGTTSPASFFSSADNLVVGTTSGNNGITILGGSTATAVLAFGYAAGTSAGDASNRAKIWYDGTSDTLRMSNGGSLMNASQLVLDASGNLLVGTASTTVGGGGSGVIGFRVDGANGIVQSAASGNAAAIFNRTTNDGTIVSLRQDGTEEGTISVSGTTVSYNGGHLSRYAQTQGTKDESLVKGTVLSNLDAMNVYTKDGQPVANEQLNKVKVSEVEGDTNVAGVFVNWTHDEDHNVDEINMAMTGDMIIRIAQGVTVVRGDLLMSAGDGTAKPQGDDIVRSKTVAKVTSTHVTCTYADGSYCVPCVLMAC